MKRKKYFMLLMCSLIFLLLILPGTFVQAAPPTIQPVLVNTILTSLLNPPSPDPAGLTYNPTSGLFIMTDSEVEEMSNLYAGKNTFILTPSGQLVDSFTTTTTPVRSYEPSGVAYNPSNGFLYFSDDNDSKVIEDNPGADGHFNTADDVVRSFSTSTFGNSDPEGISYDSWHNRLLLTSGVEEEVFIIDPGPNGVFEGSGDDIVSQFDTTVLGLRDPESIEFNYDTGNLFILSALSNKIGEVTQSGEVLRYIDITGIGSFEAGLAYAPGSNNPAEKHLYIVARGVDNNQDPNENDGKLYEISFPPLSVTPTPLNSLPPSLTGTSIVLPTATSPSMPSPTITETPSPTAVLAQDVIFVDGFESSDLSVWTGSYTNGGKLTVSSAAALIGNYGLSATVDSNTGTYIEYNHPGVERQYRTRFYFDLNSIAMASGDSHLIFYGYSNATTPVLRIELRRSSTSLYQLRPAIWNDSASWVASSYLAITDAPHYIEFDYKISDSDGANNGYLIFWVDGVQVASLTGLDNDTRPLDFIRLGPLSGIDTGTRGTYFFDAVEIRRASYIGAYNESQPTSLPTLINTSTSTSLPTLTHTPTSTPLPEITAIPSVTATFTNTLPTTNTSIPTDTHVPTQTFTPMPTNTPIVDVIFVDGFESSDLSVWTGSYTNGGKLTVSSAAALIGNYGLSATVDSNTGTYIEYNHPGVERQYRTRFYFDLNSIAMAKSDSHLIFYGYSNATTPVLRIELRKSISAYQLRPAIWNDRGSWVASSYLAITDAPHYIEFDYKISDSDGANNGYLIFWVDGVQVASLTGLDNDTRPLDFIRLGPLSGIDTGTRGTYFFDAVEIRRASYIGAGVP